MVVVEDNPADVFLIRLALHACGIDDLTVMQDGEAGYDFVTQVERGLAAAPDLFILDLSLPRRTGPELLERIKATSRACARSRVLIASSSYSSSDRSIARRLGADGYFVKPSSFEEFMKIGPVASELLAE